MASGFQSDPRQNPSLLDTSRVQNDTHASIFGPVTVIENHRRSITLPRDLLCPTHRPQPVSMMAFPGSCSKRHVSSSWLRFGRMTHVPGTAVQFPGVSSVFVFRLAGRSSLVTNTVAWDTGFFWGRSGQSLLKCPTRRQRKHLVLRICSIFGVGVCELELWLKLRSRLTTFRFCRDSLVTKVRTASSSIGHDASVVLLSVSKFVIRASLQTPLQTPVNELLGHNQVGRKSGTKRLCNVSHRVRLSCSRQNNSLAFRTQACTTQHQVAASNVWQLNPAAVRSPLSTLKRKT